MLTKSAQSDLRKKIALEKELIPKLDAYHRDLVRLFIRSVNASGQPASVASFTPRLETLLGEHYEQVQAQFTDSLAKRLPADVQPTAKERTIMATALLAYFATQAREQATTINTTTDTEARSALRLAQQEAEEAGTGLAPQALAVTGAAILHNRLRGRNLGIATTETQRAAEATKATEAEVLSGLTPTVRRRITTPPRPETQPLKRWDSVGDSHVREAHLAADDQKVPTNEPFIVGGERLMYPGDDSLGASLDNIINCRCGAEYDAGSVAENRRSVQPVEVEEPVEEPAAPATTTTTIQAIENAKPITPTVRVPDVPRTSRTVAPPPAGVRTGGAPSTRLSRKLTGDEEAYLQSYTSDGFHKFNSVLRNPTAYTDLEVQSAKRMQLSINKSNAKSTVESDGYLYRGIRSGDVFANIDEKAIGKRIQIHTPQSTSKAAGVATNYAGLIADPRKAGRFLSAEKEASVVFKIKAKAGAQVLDVSKLKDIGRAGEKEMIIPSGKSYKVTNVSGLTDADGNIVAKVIEVEYD